MAGNSRKFVTLLGLGSVTGGVDQSRGLFFAVQGELRMPSSSRPSGAATRTAAVTAAVTLAALITASPGHAQTATGEPPPGVETTPPPAAAPEGVPPPGMPGAPADQAPADQAPVNQPPVPSTGRAPAAALPAPAPQDQTTPRRTARPTPERTSVVPVKVNLRGGPTTDNEILATIPAGSTVRVGQCEGEWCAVTWNGKHGYAVARNLNVDGQSSAGAYSSGSPYSGERGPYSGEQRQARAYPQQPGQPGYGPGYPGGEVPAYGPGYYGPRLAPGPGPYHYGPPEPVDGPGYYAPRVYYYRPWNSRYGW
jgi:hypothetical protein